MKGIGLLLSILLLTGCVLPTEDTPEDPTELNICLTLHADWWNRKIRAESLELPFIEAPPVCLLPIPDYNARADTHTENPIRLQD